VSLKCEPHINSKVSTGHFKEVKINR
jgi:hypothetical protein